MSRYLVDRVAADKRIVVRRNTRIVALEGDGFLTGVRISGPAGEETLASTALFSFIGAEPASQWLSGFAALDDRGFVLTDRALGREHLKGRREALGRSPLPFETSHPGLFAVGDVRSGSTKRVAAAVGEGSAAVRSVRSYRSFDHHG
jgi:thioredoxin reductase (NADPH)